MESVSVSYVNNDMDFTFIFSRIDRNSVPNGDTINGTENDTETKALTKDENAVLEILMKDPYCTSEDIAKAIEKSFVWGRFQRISLMPYNHWRIPMISGISNSRFVFSTKCNWRHLFKIPRHATV